MTTTQEQPKQLFESPTEFSIYIEKLAIEREITLVEAILHYCELHDSEPDDVKNLISRPLKDKLEVEFQQMNYLKKNPTLDI